MTDRNTSGYLMDAVLIIGATTLTISSTLFHLLLIDHTIQRVNESIILF